MRRFLFRAKGYVRENWGVPFILGVMLLLMVDAGSLSMGLNLLANELAIYAYYALGVVLQLVCLGCQFKFISGNHSSTVWCG